MRLRPAQLSPTSPFFKEQNPKVKKSSKLQIVDRNQARLGKVGRTKHLRNHNDNVNNRV